MKCSNCGGPVVHNRDDNMCSDHCRYTFLVRRRDAILARRRRLSENREASRAKVPDTPKGVCRACGGSFEGHGNRRYCFECRPKK